MSKVIISDGSSTMPISDNDRANMKCVVMFQYGENKRDYAIYFDTTKEKATERFIKMMEERDLGDIELDGWESSRHVTFTEIGEVHIQDTTRLKSLTESLNGLLGGNSN